MRSFSLTVLFLLLLAMCGLCGVQWWRESRIREIAVGLRSELMAITAQRDQLNDRAKAADAEIVRLNAAFVELRANSVPKPDFETSMAALEQANARALAQNQALQRQNEAMQKANVTIQHVATERDSLAKKANEITAKYNALVKGKGE